MTTELADLGEGGLWLTITELAARQGVGKPTISEKVKALEAADLIKTKPGRGRQKLVNLAQFLTAVGQAGDAAKELAAETREDVVEAAPDAPAAPAYRDAQTRKTQFEADLRELDLRARLGELIEVADLVPAAQECAEAIVAALGRQKTRAAEMAAAVGHDGERGARARYTIDERETRLSIVAAFDRMLNNFAPGATVAPARETLLLWGDLDPAARS
jgi:DNA-binding MarR family transcriptional regulator